MRWTAWTLLLAALLPPGTVPAAGHPDPYHVIWAVSGPDAEGNTQLRTIKLTYHQTEKIKDMAAQKAKEKKRYQYGDYTLVGEPTIKQNCAGLVTDRLGPAALPRPFVADVDDLFEILKTFGTPATILKMGDVAVWTRDGKGAGHVGVVVGRSVTLKPVILTKEGEEGIYEFTADRIPVSLEKGGGLAFADDLDPLVQSFGPAQFWRCDLKALHWEEVTFLGPWAEEGGGASLEAAPAPNDPDAFILKRLVPDSWSRPCELVGRFRTVAVPPAKAGGLSLARGTMACRSTLSSREECGEMAQWLEAEALLQVGKVEAGAAKVELRLTHACPGFTPCRWETGPSEARPASYYRPAPGTAAEPPCPKDQKQGGKPLLFLREKTFETFDPPNDDFKPGREGKGKNSWWRMDERSFHQEHNDGTIVDASWDPMPEALAPMQKYTFTFRAKVSGPDWVEFAVFPRMDIGSWSVTLKDASAGVSQPFINAWRLRLGKEEGKPDRPEGWMTLEIQVVGKSDSIDLSNMSVKGGTGDLTHVTDLFLAVECMRRGRLTWGWSKAQ